MDTNYVDREWPRPRARVGFIIPSRNTITEPDLNRYAPAGIGVHCVRLKQVTETPLIEQTPSILVAASLLADARCDMIVYHCTGKSMGSGVAAEKRLVAQIEKKTGRRACTTASAVGVALQALGARKIVMATPYPQKTNDSEKAYLAELGVEVLRDLAAGLPKPDGVCGATPEFWVEETFKHRHPEAQAYFLSCCNMQGMGAIAGLEAKLDRPVISSNQAAFWYALRALGISDDVPAIGRLFRLGLPANALPVEASA